MKILEGAVVVGFFVAANVVAAGVVLVLGTMLNLAAPSWHSPWPWLVVGAAGALAAYLFLKGAMRCAAEWSIAAQRNPKKGLQSPRGPARRIGRPHGHELE
jgi:hypothetical protein